MVFTKKTMREMPEVVEAERLAAVEISSNCMGILIFEDFCSVPAASVR
jgi:hypothetical protein